MRNRVGLVQVIIGLMLTGLFVSGCANLSAVRTYADETKKLSAAFDPMLSGSTSSCFDNKMRKELFESSSFDPAKAEKKAKDLCRPIDEDNKIISNLNLLLEQYADTLADLAGEKLPSYKQELDGLKNSLGKVKRPDTQDSLIEAKQLDAITSLADLLSKAITQRMQYDAIRTLLNQEPAVNALTNALKDYAILNYRSWLKDETRVISVLRKSLQHQGRTEPLAANYMDLLLFKEEDQIAARDQSIDAFVKSVDSLQKTHKELRIKLDTIDDKELLAQLLSYANAVSELRKQVKEAF
jgi:hypothetical protein